MGLAGPISCVNLVESTTIPPDQSAKARQWRLNIRVADYQQRLDLPDLLAASFNSLYRR
jgi:hypothetical protein